MNRRLCTQVPRYVHYFIIYCGTAGLYCIEHVRILLLQFYPFFFFFPRVRVAS
jgi:hypothetical protein